MLWPIDEKPARQLFAEGDDPNASGGGEAKKDPPAPSFVPTDDFKVFQQSVLDGMKSLTESVQALAASRVAGDPNASRPPERVITPEEYESAISRVAAGQTQDGDSKTMSEYVKQLSRQGEARVAQLEAAGANSIDAMSAAMAETTLPHYKRFKKEIDGQMANFPAVVRM